MVKVSLWRSLLTWVFSEGEKLLSFTSVLMAVVLEWIPTWSSLGSCYFPGIIVLSIALQDGFRILGYDSFHLNFMMSLLRTLMLLLSFMWKLLNAWIENVLKGKAYYPGRHDSYTWCYSMSNVLQWVKMFGGWFKNLKQSGYQCISYCW